MLYWEIFSHLQCKSSAIWDLSCAKACAVTPDERKSRHHLEDPPQ